MLCRAVAIGQGILFASVLATFAAAELTDLRFNHTPSLPIGLWQATDDRVSPYRRGEIVEVCPELAGWMRRYLAAGQCPSGREPMLKPIVAVAGDTVVVSSFGVIINGRRLADTAPLVHDSIGRPLTAYPAGVYPVPAGQLWLIAPHLDSLDSRYMGPVLVSAIRARMRPVWVWP